ncbi:predicted protein [Histoplasma capsulatum H143]|uniref:Uncharacterized protein n=1 Tax=Ajellomyces capsulatus (strain H143) TaxID=544712 RepID=C6H9L1_AJECH|nr:predicted protein [Histoplasma capsulatum H143]
MVSSLSHLDTQIFCPSPQTTITLQKFFLLFFLPGNNVKHPHISRDIAGRVFLQTLPNTTAKSTFPQSTSSSPTLKCVDFTISTTLPASPLLAYHLQETTLNHDRHAQATPIPGLDGQYYLSLPNCCWT